MGENQRVIFVENLKGYMAQRGIAQSDIVSELGYSASTVSDWVTGKKYPRVDAMQKLADFIGIQISDLTTDHSPTQYVSTGRRLEQLLEASNISYDEELARQLGTDMYGLETWLEGSRTPTFEELTRAARVFGVTLATVRGETKEIVREAQDDDVWAEREALRRDPDRRALLDLARHGPAKSVRQVAALIDALKATNPDFYDGDDPA